MSQVEVRLRVLYPPKEAKCDEEYDIGNYKFCFDLEEAKVYIWDKPATTPEFADFLLQAEEILKRHLFIQERTPQETVETIKEVIPPEYSYIVERQFMGLGVLDPLMKDDQIIDIHIVLGQPIQVIHRTYGRLTTNIMMSEDEIRELILRLASSAGKVISEAKPIASFIEPYYESRVTVSYLSDVTLRRGMTVDIRKQPKKPWTILKLIDLGTVTVEEAAYLWLMMKYRAPILIMGELMSGKTTMATAILNLIPPDSRVITIEDAPELRVYVPYWTRTTTREAEAQPITVFDLLKIAMRISADYIVVGEVRGEEAREWAQGLLLGHGGITTIHADSPEAALLRLTSPPIEVNPQALKLLNVFVRMIPIRAATGLVRRSEVYIHEDREIIPLFRYNPATDKIELVRDDPLAFKFIERFVLASGKAKEEIYEEYKAMIDILGTVYQEAKARDPSLETPDYRELPMILYKMLRERLGGRV